MTKIVTIGESLDQFKVVDEQGKELVGSCPILEIEERICHIKECPFNKDKCQAAETGSFSHPNVRSPEFTDFFKE